MPRIAACGGRARRAVVCICLLWGGLITPNSIGGVTSGGKGQMEIHVLRTRLMRGEAMH
ncbi:hypothetical protein BDV10DRAFT_173509 [Aspergillus recurvatus]